MKELADNGAGGKEAVIASTPVPLVVKEPQKRPDVGDTTPKTRTTERPDSPLVSVIIPAYNAERFIARTLDSVLSQTYRNIEVIVVDDGSTDQTFEIVNRNSKMDSRIKLLQQPNRGVAEARNVAIAASKGEFIAPIDADDVWHRDKLREQVECILREPPSVGLVYSWSVMIDENENPILRIAHEWNGDVLADMVYSNFVGNGSAPLIRRSCLDDAGFYDGELTPCEDWDLYLRIAEMYEFQVVSKYRVGYRRVAGGGSTDFERMERAFGLLMNKLRHRRPDIPGPILRLSASCFCLYLTRKSNERGHYFKTFRLLMRGLRLDATLLLSTLYLRILLETSLRMLASPIVSRIGKNYDVWGNLRRGLKRLRTNGPLNQTTLGLWDVHYGHRMRLYDRIKNHRMRQFKERIKTHRQVHGRGSPVACS
jgi:glycosyltransferase involved in cell wall biosynthesis